MPEAARITDQHSCPRTEPGNVPHVGGPVQTGEETVRIGNQPAARVGDALTCTGGPPDTIQTGEPTVRIGHQDAARRGDPTEHGGVIEAGCPTVIIGSSPQAETLQTDMPFCEECEGG